MSTKDWRETSEELNKLALDKDDQNVHTNALLIYLLEGLFPLISAFCTELSMHLSGSSSCCLVDEQLNVLKDLTTVLTVSTRIVYYM